MGLGTNGNLVLYSLKLSSRAELVTIATYLRQREITSADPTDQSVVDRPVIYVDANNIINVVGRKTVNPVATAANFLLEFAQEGLIIAPICDGTRPQSKQQTNKSRADRQKYKHKSVILRQDLRRIGRQLKEADIDAASRERLEKEQTELCPRIKSAETSSVNVVPPHFPELLEQELIKISAHDKQRGGGYVMPVITAMFEADALIKGAFQQRKFQLVMSNDADYPVDLGDQCLAIKDFGKKDLVISSTSKETLMNAMSCLGDDSNAELVVPSHPIYEGVDDMRTRALISVIIGCDVCPGGLPNIGVKKVSTELSKFRESSANNADADMYKNLLDYAVAAPPSSFTEEVLTTLVDAIMYQPTNVIGCEGERTYISDAPQQLPAYLEQFKSDTTIMTSGPDMLECKGASHGHSHNFLAGTKHHNCSKCNEVLCRLCSTTLDKSLGKKGWYCLACYLEESILPDEENMNTYELTTRQMRRELTDKYNFSGADELSVEEVEEAWLSYALQRKIESMADDVPFPIYEAQAIDDGDKWEVKAEIDFTKGASDIFSDNIEDESLPELLELLAAFVRFGSPDQKHTSWQKDGSVYSAIPQMFIDFAKKCRVDVCYRLLRRCLRHAFDGRTESLDNKTAKIVLCNGELGIHLSSPIPASMKTDIYDGDIVLTKDKILCAKCDCMSGAQGKNRNVCVHIKPRGILLSILLAEDLAEHILLEFTSMLTSPAVETDNWSTEQIEKVKESILILMEASGEVVIAREAAKKDTIYDMLQPYKTGTQEQKQWDRKHKPPTADEVGPFDQITADSPEQKAKEVFHRSSPKNKLERTEEVVEFAPDYVQTGIVLNASGYDPSKSDYVGFQLLEHRRSKQVQQMDLNSMPQMISTAQSDWQQLLEEAESRSMRQSTKQQANLMQNQLTTPSRRKRISDEMHPPLITPSPEKKKKSGAKQCSKVGCTNAEGDDGILFNRVPAEPQDLPDGASLERKLTYRARRELWLESMDRIGRGRGSDNTKGLRICNCHPTETIRRRLYVEHNGDTASKLFELTVVAGAGVESSIIPSQATKGVGKDRFVQRHLRELRDDVEAARKPEEDLSRESSPIERENIRLKGELASTRFELQRIAELTSVDSQNASPITCPTVEKSAGFVAWRDKPSNLGPSQKKRFGVVAVENSLLRASPKKNDGSVARKKSRTGRKRLAAELPPIVLPNMDDKEVKRRTGFFDVSTLLAYIIVVCNGDFDRIRKRRTPLTWFEEWFLWFEFKYHMTNNRQIDLEAEWGIDKRFINRVKDCKAALDMAAFRSWPRFASFEEDLKLRNSQKWAKYDPNRVIQWDMTNVPLPKFADADLYRVTYNKYYGMNCGKLGVGMQLCGWIIPEKMWTGAVEDGTYHAKAGYMEAQKRFQEADLVDGKVIKFHNILDRGYRGNVSAFRNDQLCLQPPSSRSDRRFTGRQTIFAGAVARDRGGNERGVRVMKRSGLFSKGFQVGMSPQRFSDALLAWGFQANFMYKRVH